MTRFSRFAIPAVLVLVALVALPAAAQTINTYPGWNGSDVISSFGYPNTATYGEAITTPEEPRTYPASASGSTEIPGFEFQAFVSPWDNNNYALTGSMLYLVP